MQTALDLPGVRFYGPSLLRQAMDAPYVSGQQRYARTKPTTSKPCKGCGAAITDSPSHLSRRVYCSEDCKLGDSDKFSDADLRSALIDLRGTLERESSARSLLAPLDVPSPSNNERHRRIQQKQLRMWREYLDAQLLRKAER